MKFRIASSIGVLALAACAHAPEENPLLGAWLIDPPTLPRAHGNEVAFHEECLIVGGDRINVRVVKPVRYAVDGREVLVWFGAAWNSSDPGAAARARFLAADRIEVRWPEGLTARYLRSFDGDSERRRAACGAADG